jgi:aspartate aminotransferase
LTTTSSGKIGTWQSHLDNLFYMALPPARQPIYQVFNTYPMPASNVAKLPLYSAPKALPLPPLAAHRGSPMKSMSATPQFSKSLATLQLSPIVSISERARVLAPEFKARTGEDFVYFQRGEINFPTPEYIVAACGKALGQGLTKYPKSGGETVFKEAIARKMARVNGTQGLQADDVVVTYGGQEALELVFKLFEGQRGAGFAPCWSCVLENFVPYCQIDFEEVPLNADFSVNYEALDKVLQKVAFFYLNTPQNPTGKVFTEQEIRGIADLCEKYGVFMISDEAYERIVFDGIDYFSPMALNKPFILGCYTLSKTYAMTGWRLGYIVCRDPKIAKMLRLGDYSQTAGVVTFLQYAGAEALDNIAAEEAFLKPILVEYERRRDFLYQELSSIEGLLVNRPQGAFYFFPDFSSFVPGDLSAQAKNLHVYQKFMDAGVATVFGLAFGKHFGSSIRLSFSCTDVNDITAGIRRMKEALDI